MSAAAASAPLTTEALLGLDPVIPVVVLDDAELAVPLARALLAGGLRTVEVTLRTPAALEAIARIATEVPEIALGAGTIAHSQQVEAAAAAGARFLVSPGATPALLDAMSASGLPFLAGVATPSDVLALLERRIAHAKLFPAEVVGGVAMARTLAGPFPQLRLCPTGGIAPERAREYLALPNVACVGGSWIAAGAPDWDDVTARARAAAALR